MVTVFALEHKEIRNTTKYIVQELPTTPEKNTKANKKYQNNTEIYLEQQQLHISSTQETVGPVERHL